MSNARLIQRLGQMARTAPGSVSMSEFSSSAAPAFKLPDLPYDYSALEPYISGQIMELHHGKHHATYVANLNKGLEQLAEAEHKKDVAKMIALQEAIKFNGGGEQLPNTTLHRCIPCSCDFDALHPVCQFYCRP